MNDLQVASLRFYTVVPFDHDFYTVVPPINILYSSSVDQHFYTVSLRSILTSFVKNHLGHVPSIIFLYSVASLHTRSARKESSGTRSLDHISIQCRFAPYSLRS